MHRDSESNEGMVHTMAMIAVHASYSEIGKEENEVGGDTAEKITESSQGSIVENRLTIEGHGDASER
jgi:hypothetical protein